MRTGFKLLGLVLVMALLAACGGGGGSGDTSTTTAAPAETTTTAPNATTTTDDDGPDGLSQMCIEASQGMSEAMEAYGQSFGSTGATDFELISEQLDAMAEAAPSEVRADFEVLARELGKFYEAMSDFSFTPGQTPTPEQLAAMQAAVESVDQEALEAASANIEAWVEDNCS